MELSLGVPSLREHLERGGGPAWGPRDLGVPRGEGA